jgi:stage III sporulation protein AF
VEGIKEWVKGLVLLALLASCLELVLPMGNMKRYVKLTMGLLIVLATLKPIFGFLGQPVAVTANFVEADAGAPGVPTLGQIMASAAAFREKNEALAVGEVESGLSAEAARAARSVNGVADAEAEVRLEEGKESVTIKAVTVRIIPGAPGKMAQGHPGETTPVHPVEPVTPVGGEPGAGAGAGPEAGKLSATEKRLAESVRREVAARLGLESDPGRVQVLFMTDGR